MFGSLRRTMLRGVVRSGAGVALGVALSFAQVGLPALAAPAVTATDNDINWGTAEKHFTQNKQAESPMATNPTNALNSVTGAEDFVREPDCTTDPSSGGSVCLPGQTINTIGVYTTKDGGATWSKQILDFSSIGKLANADPAVTFGPRPDDNGEFSYEHGARAYLSAMAFPIGNVSIFGEPVVVIVTSDDGGTTWTSPRIATDDANPKAKFNDKPMIWADNNPSSPHFGNVYLVWALITGVDSSGSTFTCGTCPFSIQFARSTNGGRTWSEPMSLSPSTNTVTGGNPEDAYVRTDREGRVIVAWEDHIGATQAPSQMVSRVSEDGGLTFDDRVIVGPTLDMFVLPGTSFPNANTIAMDVDQATDTIYATWANYRAVNSIFGHATVVVMKSVDHGKSWKSAGTVDVPGRSAFHPSIAVARNGAAPGHSQTPGRVVVGFTAISDVPASTPPVTGSVNYLPYLAASDDGGDSWSTPTTPIGVGPSDPSAAGGFLNDLGSEFVGDYSSMSAAPDGRTFFFSYTSTQEGTGCAAVDAYRLGIGPLPNIYRSCPPAFGNVDIHVAVAR